MPKKTQKWIVFKEGEIDEDTRKIISPDDWRREMLNNLQSFKGEKSDFVKEIIDHEKTPSLMHDDYNNFLQIIPKKMQAKAKILLLYLLPKIKLDDNNCIIYLNKTGSPLIDLLLFILTPAHLKKKMPPDIGDFAQLLLDLKIPRSAISRDDLETLSKLKDRNIFDVLKSENEPLMLNNNEVVWENFETFSNK
jgi:hypothetical protein